MLSKKLASLQDTSEGNKSFEGVETPDMPSMSSSQMLIKFSQSPQRMVSHNEHSIGVAVNFIIETPAKVCRW